MVCLCCVLPLCEPSTVGFGNDHSKAEGLMLFGLFFSSYPVVTHLFSPSYGKQRVGKDLFGLCVALWLHAVAHFLCFVLIVVLLLCLLDHG